MDDLKKIRNVRNLDSEDHLTNGSLISSGPGGIITLYLGRKQMNKFEKIAYDVFGVVFVILMLAVALAVPTGALIWAIRWILTMIGVIV